MRRSRRHARWRRWFSREDLSPVGFFASNRASLRRRSLSLPQNRECPCKVSAKKRFPKIGNAEASGAHAQGERDPRAYCCGRQQQGNREKTISERKHGGNTSRQRDDEDRCAQRGAIDSVWLPKRADQICANGRCNRLG